MKYLLIVMVLMTACGQQDIELDRSAATDIDARLIPIVEQWKADMQDAGISYAGLSGVGTIKIGALDAPRLGLCEYGRLNTITLIDGLSPEMQKVVLYHELGHCALHQDHWGQFGDIMFSTIMRNDLYWERRWDQALEVYKVHIFTEQQLHLLNIAAGESDEDEE